ncbi:hypothetical protein HQ602_08165 [Rhodococcus kroppenstedtii]|uniref:SipW-dependent-type signal peptide-containing protein n=1 Tax=Rhodococcoides kroppenstedtii TaxID=293050 RepID=UPI001C9B7042|nr:SipW-dependent-type signal peptide-containing protein [Rhodococcus kroppenstedtii]MBY6436354.1 hypothetical protein [Rhodococcus kroppenstedtii]
MTTDLSHDSERDDRSVRRRKVRALLAGGLVLGVGAAVTLAAWTDNVFGQAQFSAADWNVQGSFDGGTTWAEYDNTDPLNPVGQFRFSDGFGKLSPGESVAAPVALRVGSGNGGEYDASVTLLGATLPAVSPLSDFLEYSVYTGVAPGDCTPLNMGGATAIVDNQPLTQGSAGGAIELLADGTVENLCFEVYFEQQTNAAASAGITTGPVVWQFAATAVE